MRMMAPIPARVIQVLKDYLPAELDLIDSEEAQTATPDIASGDYWEYKRPVVLNFPCVRLDIKGMSTVGIDALPNNPLQRRIDVWHRLEVWVDVQIRTGEEDALSLQRLILTYAKGIYRVLCVRQVQLETVADPTAWASEVEPDGEIRYHAEAEQEGVMVRSGVVPIKVRRIEALA